MENTLLYAALFSGITLIFLFAFYQDSRRIGMSPKRKSVLGILLTMNIILLLLAGTPLVMKAVNKLLYESALTNCARRFVWSLPDSLFQQPAAPDTTLRGHFLVWRGEAYELDGASDNRSNTVGRYPDHDVPWDSLKYLALYKYELHSTKNYQVHSYRNSPFGKQNEYSGPTSRSNYAILAYVFDIQLRKCIASRRFDPPPLSNYYGTYDRPIQEDFSSYANWIRQVFGSATIKIQ